MECPLRGRRRPRPRRGHLYSAADIGRRLIALAAALSAVCLAPATRAGAPFDFKRDLFGPPGTLSLSLEQVDPAGGVVLNGGDSRQPNLPFTFDWGDGMVEDGWFPGTHTYADTQRNYVAAVTAHYADGSSDTAPTAVWFAAPIVQPVPLPDRYRVTVPTTMVDLVSRMPGYGFSGSLTVFDDASFARIPRPAVEYVLSAAASLEARMANEDVSEVDGAFRQVLLRDPNAGGMYSLWYASPAAFGVADYGFAGSIEWSSFLHEMGHNVTLNFPAAFYYGGKIDGNANAIYSETLAQVFQHAATYEMLNAPQRLGLDDALAADIAGSGHSSIQLLRRLHEDYVRAGMPFASWNDPATPEDETLGTFMTLGFRFCVHAETAGRGYMTPCRRMTRLLGLFDADLRRQYDQEHNTQQASTYRATLLVAALSYAFEEDLRAEFRGLGFPVDDMAYDDLIRRTAWKDARRILAIASGLESASGEDAAALDVEPSPGNPAVLDLSDAARLVRRASGLDGL